MVLVGAFARISCRTTVMRSLMGIRSELYSVSYRRTICCAAVYSVCVRDGIVSSASSRTRGVMDWTSVGHVGELRTRRHLPGILSRSQRCFALPSSKPPASRPISRPISRPASLPASRPTSRPTSRPINRPASLPTSRPTTLAKNLLKAFPKNLPKTKTCRRFLRGLSHAEVSWSSSSCAVMRSW